MKRNLLKSLTIVLAIVLGFGISWAAVGDVVTVIDNPLTEGVTNPEDGSYTWGTDITLDANGLLLTNGDNKANNYEGRNFVTFANTVGDESHEVNISYDVKYQGKSKGQAYSNFVIGYYDEDGKFIFSIEECIGNWADKSYITYAVSESETAKVELPTHIGKSVNATVKFAGGMAIVNIDDMAFAAASAKGIKDAKLSVTGDRDYGRGIYVSNFKIATTEVQPAVFADFTVNFVKGEEIVKTEKGTGEVGTTPVLTPGQIADFFVEDLKYIYLNNDAEGLTIAEDGSTVVKVEVRDATLCKLRVRGPESKNMKTYENIYEGETFYFAVPKYVLMDSEVEDAETGETSTVKTFWQCAATDGVTDANFSKGCYQCSYTLAKGTSNSTKNQAVQINYNQLEGDAPIFYVEAEDIEGFIAVTGNNANIRSSNGAGAYSETEAVITTLEPGKYTIESYSYDARETVTFKAGSQEIFTITTKGTVSGGTQAFSVFTTSDITVSAGNSTTYFDYVVIRKTGDITAEDIAAYNEASATADYAWWEGLCTELTEAMAGNEEYVTADTRQAIEEFMKEDNYPSAINASFEDATENGTVYVCPFDKAMIEAQVRGWIAEINGIKNGEIALYSETGLVGSGTDLESAPFANTIVGVDVYATNKVVIKGWDGVEGSDLTVVYAQVGTLNEGEEAEPRTVIIGLEQTVNGEVVSVPQEDEEDGGVVSVTLMPQAGDYSAFDVQLGEEMTSALVGTGEETGMGAISLYGAWYPKAVAGEDETGDNMGVEPAVAALYMVQWPVDIEAVNTALATADYAWWNDLCEELTAAMAGNEEYITADTRQAIEEFMKEDNYPSAIQAALEDAIEAGTVYACPFDKALIEAQVRGWIAEIEAVKNGEIALYTENGVVGGTDIDKNMPYFNTPVGVEVYANQMVVIKGWDGVEGSDLKIAYTLRNTLEEGEDVEPQIAILGIEQTVDGEVVSEFVEDDENPELSYVSLIPQAGDYVAAMVYPFSEMTTVLVGKDEETGMGQVSLYGTWAKMPEATEPEEGEVDPGFGIPELETIEAAYIVTWPGKPMVIPAELLYTAKAATVDMEDTENYGDSHFATDEIKNINVEVYDDNTVIVRGWAGVAGNDLKVAFDAEDNVTAVTPIVNGVAEETVESGYANLKSGDGKTLQVYVAPEYNYAGEEDGEGYVMLYGYLGGVWGYYYIAWPQAEVEPITLAELVDMPATEEGVEVMVNLEAAKVTAAFDMDDYIVAFIENDEAAVQVAAAEIEAGKALTGIVAGTWADYGNGAVLMITENNTTAEDVDVKKGREIVEEYELLMPENLNRLVTVVNSPMCPIMTDPEMPMAFIGESMMTYDIFYALGDEYVYPENVKTITGVLVPYAGMTVLVPRSAEDIVEAAAPVEVPEFAKYFWAADADGNVTEVGGMIEANADAEGRLNYAQAGYYTICLNGKKDFSTGYMTVTLDEPLAAGDIIYVTAFRNKDAEGKSTGAKFRFNGDDSNTLVTGDGETFNNINPDYATGDGKPNKVAVEVTAAQAGCTTFDITRQNTGTNLFITELYIWNKDVATGINNATVNMTTDAIYNLAGQKVDAQYKGIIIVNGKKILNK